MFFRPFVAAARKRKENSTAEEGKGKGKRKGGKDQGLFPGIQLPEEREEDITPMIEA